MDIHKICCRGNGTCKHCVSLLFAVSDFCCRHKGRSTEVGTNVECVWNKPRNESTPLKVDGMNIRISMYVSSFSCNVYSIQKKRV